MFPHLIALALATAVPSIGKTFGNALAGMMICEGKGSGGGGGPVDTAILNYTLTPSSSAVLTHFWLTGNAPAIDEAWISYFVDGETVPSIVFQPSAMCGQFFPELMNSSHLYSAGIYY